MYTYIHRYHTAVLKFGTVNVTFPELKSLNIITVSKHLQTIAHILHARTVTKLNTLECCMKLKHYIEILS